MEYILDGRQMTDRSSAHAHLQMQLELPAHYGRNLDALYDLLTERREPCSITVQHWEAMEQSLGHYAAALLDTLFDAAKANGQLEITVKNPTS